ncbi:MAG TPA: DUF992 domain-containing protein [Paracoccaceae bacterium]|nr:DUF992 domain-containing protein [Paracoccaceae bacterium]
MQVRAFLLGGGAAAACLLAGLAWAEPAGIEIGTLQCEQTGLSGGAAVTDAHFSCIYNPHDAGPEYFAGRIASAHPDLAMENTAKLRWLVLASTDSVKPSALSGTYQGRGAAQAPEAGSGLLVGGHRSSVTLQPVTPSPQEGAPAGIEAFELKHGGS